MRVKRIGSVGLRLSPDEADVVIAFVIDDMREAMAEVEAAGLAIEQVPD